jgi:hypothetical protein
VTRRSRYNFKLCNQGGLLETRVRSCASLILAVVQSILFTGKAAIHQTSFGMSDLPANSSGSPAADPDWKAAYHDMRKVADNYAEQIKSLTGQLTFMQHAFLEKTHENSNSSGFAVAARPTLKDTQKVVPSPRNGLLVKPKANSQIDMQKVLHPVDQNVEKESAFEQLAPFVGDAQVDPEGSTTNAVESMRLSTSQTITAVGHVAKLDIQKVKDLHLEVQRLKVSMVHVKDAMQDLTGEMLAPTIIRLQHSVTEIIRRVVINDRRRRMDAAVIGESSLTVESLQSELSFMSSKPLICVAILEGTLDPRYAENEQQFSHPSDVELGVKGLIGAAEAVCIFSFDNIWKPYEGRLGLARLLCESATRLFAARSTSVLTFHTITCNESKMTLLDVDNIQKPFHQHVSTFFMSKLDSMATELIRDTRLHYQFAVLRIPIIKGSLGDAGDLYLSGEEKPRAIAPQDSKSVVEKLKHLHDITDHAISDAKMNSMSAQVTKMSCLQRQQAAVLQASGHANIVIVMMIVVYEPAIAYRSEMSKFVGIDVFMEGNSDSIATDEVFISVQDAAKMFKKDGVFTADMRYGQMFQSMSRGTTNKNARNLGPSARDALISIITDVSKMSFQCEANRQTSLHNEISALHFHYRKDTSQNLTAFTSSSLMLGASNCTSVQTQLTREARLAVVVTRWKNQKIQRAMSMWKMLMTLGIEEKLNAELEIYKGECAQLKARNEELQQRSRFLASAGLGSQYAFYVFHHLAQIATLLNLFSEIVASVDNGKALEEAQSRNHKFLQDSKKERGKAAILQAEIEVQAMKGRVAYAESLLRKDKLCSPVKKHGR